MKKNHFKIKVTWTNLMQILEAGKKHKKKQKQKKLKKKIQIPPKL